MSFEGLRAAACAQLPEVDPGAAAPGREARRVLAASGLVPRTLRGRARLKRLVFGKLRELPPELPEGFATAAPRTPLGPGPVRGFKVIYVGGRKGAARV